MWVVKCQKQVIHAGKDFKLAYRMAFIFKGNLIYKPNAGSYSPFNRNWFRNLFNQITMRTSFYFHNELTSKQDEKAMAVQMLEAIINNSGDTITLTVDDGDGDVWKYTLDISCERIDKVTQVIEN